jgi:hypothetical protein
MTSERWTAERALAWYAGLPWVVGCNFLPSTAVNQLEMWQEETFDEETIGRELRWASDLGFNSMRVFLHDLLWDAEPEGFAERIDRYLAIASSRGISTAFVLFDDCWHEGARLGPQPAPVPGRHNSRWLQSPGHGVVADASALPRLEAYVRGVVGRFAADDRVLMWDLYNEVANGFLPLQAERGEAREAAFERALQRRAEAMPAHLRLLELAFECARSAGAQQPLTSGMYTGERELNDRLASLSDVITFHCYEPADRLEALIGRLRRHGRPLVCTEYMARTRGSDFRSAMPVFKREGVGCYSWGLVNGKSQTHIAWTGEQDVWFHDILRGDGMPYDAEESSFIRGVTGVG